MKFIKGQIYKMQYIKDVPFRCDNRGRVIESEKRLVKGYYKFIGNRGPKFHFYDDFWGIDVMFSKAEAFKSVVE